MNIYTCEKCLSSWQLLSRSNYYVMKTNKTLPAIKKRYSYDEVVDVIQKSEGVRTTICKMLDCSQTQLRNYLEEHSELKQVMLDAREQILDLAESVIRENLTQTENPELRQRCAEFTLKTIGRHRGWAIGDYPAMQVNVSKTGDDIRVQLNALFGMSE